MRQVGPSRQPGPRNFVVLRVRRPDVTLADRSCTNDSARATGVKKAPSSAKKAFVRPAGPTTPITRFARCGHRRDRGYRSPLYLK
eukprot:2216864-Prymnesium_polylepis.1